MPTVTPTSKMDMRGVTFSWSDGRGINDDDDNLEPGAEEKDSMASENAQTPEPLKVLIVSRDPQTPRMLEEILNREGILVDAPEETVAAWNQVRSGEVGLVVYDLTNPRLD